MTQKNSSNQKPLLNLRISTFLAILFIIIAVVFAGLGFSKAGDSRVAPALVSIYLFVSGIFFAGQFVVGIRSQERWQRVIAVVSILAALFVVAMAIGFYQALTQVQMPTQ